MLMDRNVTFYVSIFITGTFALTRNVILSRSRDLGHNKWWVYIEQAISDKIRKDLFPLHTWEKQVMTYVFWHIIGFDICQDENILISDFGIESEKPEKQIYALCADITIEATFECRRTDNIGCRPLGGIVDIVAPKTLALNLTLLRLDKDSDPIACGQHLFKVGYKTSSNEYASIAEMCGIPFAHNVFVPSNKAVLEFEHHEDQHHEVVQLQVQAIYPVYGNCQREMQVSVPIAIPVGDHVQGDTLWNCSNSTQSTSRNVTPTCSPWYRNPAQAPLLGVVQLLGNQLHFSALRIWTLETPLNTHGQFLFRQVSIYFPPQDCNSRKKDMTAIFDGPYLGILTPSRVQTPFANLFRGECVHLNSSVVYTSSIGELTVSWANPMAQDTHNSSIVFGYKAQPLSCRGKSCFMQTIPVTEYSDAMVTIPQRMRPTIHLLKFVKTNPERQISLKVSTKSFTILHWRENCTISGLFITEITLKAAICSGYGLTLLNTSTVRRPLYFHNSEVVIAVKSYPNIFNVQLDVIYSATRCMGFFNAYATLSRMNSLKTATCSIEFASGGHSTQVIMNGDSKCCFSMDYFPTDDKDLRKHIKNSMKLIFKTRNHDVLNLKFTQSRVHSHIRTRPAYKDWECFNLYCATTDVLVTTYVNKNRGRYLYYRPSRESYLRRTTFVDPDITLKTSLAKVYLYPVEIKSTCESTWTWYRISVSITDQVLDEVYVRANEFSFNSSHQPLFEYEPVYLLGRIHLPQKVGRTYSFIFNRWDVKLSRMSIVIPSHIDISITQTTKLSQSNIYGANVFEFITFKYSHRASTRVQYTGHALRLTLNDIPGPEYEAVIVHYVNFYHFVKIQYRMRAITRENSEAIKTKSYVDFLMICGDSRCYAIRNRPCDSSWNICRIICKKYGWDLLSINSDTEWNEVKSFLQSVKNLQLAVIYLSLRSSENGDLNWLDETPYSYANWNDHPDTSMAVIQLPKDLAEMKRYSLPPWPKDFLQQLSRLQPSSSATCTAIFVLTLTSVAWIKIPCDMQISHSYVLCEYQRATPEHVEEVVGLPKSFCVTNTFKYKHSCLNISPITKKVQCLSQTCFQGAHHYNNEMKLLVTDVTEISWLFLKLLGEDRKRHIFAENVFENYTCSLLSSLWSIEVHPQMLLDDNKPPNCSKLMKRADAVLTLESPVPLIVTCLPGQAKCNDDTCILDAFWCDGETDCPDKSDESHCSAVCQLSHQNNRIPNSSFCLHSCKGPECQCLDHYYQCKTGGCIPWAYVCNCFNNCKDGSDEQGCASCQDYTPTALADSNAFQCKRITHITRYIARHKVNDMKPDCQDGQDEKTYIRFLQNGSQNIEVCGQVDHVPCVSGFPRCFPKSDICVYDKDRYGMLKHCRNGEHLHQCKDFECPGKFKCPNSYCIPFHLVCNRKMDCPHGEEEAQCNIKACPGLMKCKDSTVCIHPDNVQDQLSHCHTWKEDEAPFIGQPCPSNCSCRGQSVICRYSKPLDFKKVHSSTKFLDVSNSVLISHTVSFVELTLLLSLDLSFVCLTGFPRALFSPLVSLMSLRLQQACIKSIVPSTFSGLFSLYHLGLAGNKLKQIHSYSFSYFVGMVQINLSRLHLSTINSCAFNNMHSCKVLDLSFNNLSSIGEGTFCGLQNLVYLDLRANIIASLDTHVLYGMENLKQVLMPSRSMCCLVPAYISCSTSTIRFDPCHNLVPSKVLESWGWINVICILLGNIVTLLCWHHKPSLYGTLMIVMAIADISMALPLLLLLSANIHMLERFHMMHRITWLSSLPCLLATVSQFMSFCMSKLIVIAVSLCRLFGIIQPLKAKQAPWRIRLSGYIVTCFAVVCSLSFLLIYSKTYIRSPNIRCMPFDFHDFYTQHIPNAIFMCMTGVCLLAIIILNSALLWALIRKDPMQQSRVMSVRFKRKITALRRVSVTFCFNTFDMFVLTICGLSAATGLKISEESIAWLSFIVLPFSALSNPFLYTITCTPFVKLISSIKK